MKKPVAHTERAHAILAPSSASRWIACPGSIAACEGIPDKSSIFADEGTAAHMLAEYCLQHNEAADSYLGSFIDIRGKQNIVTDPGDNRFPIDEEMVEGVQLYVDFCQNIFDRSDMYLIEQRLALPHIDPDIFGTVDACGYMAATGHLHVPDFKYGAGVPVNPNENPQGLCYASAATHYWERKGYEVRKITISIVQPRAPHKDGPIRSWTIDRGDLHSFNNLLKAAAVRAKAVNAERRAGSHCRFCRAAPMCPERKELSAEQARIEFGAVGEIKTPELAALTSADLGKMLSEIDQVEAWCRRVREYAHEEAVHGRSPEGYKLVAKRAFRKWKDEIYAAKELLFAGLNRDELHVTKLISPAQADKLLGKKDAEKIKGLWLKESSGSTLAPVADPRPAVGTDPKDEFGAVT
jgi:hypothetical protein